jgi:N-acetylglucosaminyldiphosphoundecaprenol N-acetyl-beta-D-mannosaminyltransferase
MANVLVFGKRDKKVKELERILTEHSHDVCLVSGLADSVELLSGNNFHLIVLTDSLKDRLDQDFLHNLRRLFPHAKILCLANRITQAMEIGMRSAGLVFLGSYKRFNQFAWDILQAAMESLEGRGNS